MGQEEEGNAMSGYSEIALLQYELEKLRARIAEKDEVIDMAAPFTPTALNELIEKVEKLTIERCAERVSFFTPYVGNKIRALPTGQIKLEELI